MVVDPSRAVYQALDMARGALKTLSLRSIPAAVAAARQGHSQSAVAGDPFQLGGAAIVRAGGAVDWTYRSRFAGDHPSNDDILAAL